MDGISASIHRKLRGEGFKKLHTASNFDGGLAGRHYCRQCAYLQPKLVDSISYVRNFEQWPTQARLTKLMPNVGKNLSWCALLPNFKKNQKRKLVSSQIRLVHFPHLRGHLWGVQEKKEELGCPRICRWTSTSRWSASGPCPKQATAVGRQKPPRTPTCTC